MLTGQVIRTQNSFYYVQAGNAAALVACRLRGRFKKEHCQVVTGDRVEFEALPDGTGIIEKRLARETLLRRPAVANINQVVLTFAARQPDLHPLLLNRFLVLAEWSGIRHIRICVNKMDLLPAAEWSGFLSLYESIGYEVLRVSARESIGLEALQKILPGNVTVFAGPSGVGKSTLLNGVDDRLALATGRISDKIKRGRHTTRLAQLLPLQAGGWVVDTPGFSATELERIDRNELAGYFPEFRSFMNDCRYNTCTHSHEPQCAVKSAVEAGKIHAERYEAYLNILQEIMGRKKEYE